MHWEYFMYNNILHYCALWYLFLALGGGGILGGGCHYFLLHYTHKSLLRLGMEGHCALGQLLDAYCVVPLSRQHILVTNRISTLALC